MVSLKWNFKIKALIQQVTSNEQIKSPLLVFCRIDPKYTSAKCSQLKSSMLNLRFYSRGITRYHPVRELSAVLGSGCIVLNHGFDAGKSDLYIFTAIDDFQARCKLHVNYKSGIVVVASVSFHWGNLNELEWFRVMLEKLEYRSRWVV